MAADAAAVPPHICRSTRNVVNTSKIGELRSPALSYCNTMLCHSRLGNYEAIRLYKRRLCKRTAASFEPADAPADLHGAKVPQLPQIDASNVSTLHGHPTFVKSGVRHQLVRLDARRKPHATSLLDVWQSLRRGWWHVADVDLQSHCLGCNSG